VVAAAAPEDDGDDGIIEHCRCTCGGVGAITFEVDHDGDWWCVIRCPCGAFTLAEPDGGSR
jgi:hypothetical protein